MGANLERARAYLRAIESGGDVLGHYDPAVVQREYPNRFLPQGATRGLAELEAAQARGKRAVSEERYEVLHALESGDELALRVAWSARLAVPVGALKAGETMRANFALFMRFREGRIVEQHNYDCFDPF